MRSPLRDTDVEERTWRADSVLEKEIRSDTREASASVSVGSWQRMGPLRAQPPLVLLCRAAGYGRREPTQGMQPAELAQDLCEGAHRSGYVWPQVRQSCRLGAVFAHSAVGLPAEAQLLTVLMADFHGCCAIDICS